MKVLKDGQIKLSSQDYRVGNFIYTNFANSVGFSDINRTVQIRISKRVLVGLMIEKAIKEKNDNFLHNYAGFLYYANGIAPDQVFLKEFFNAAVSCIERHKDIYGEQEVSNTKESQIIEQLKGTQEFIDELKNNIPVEEK